MQSKRIDDIYEIHVVSRFDSNTSKEVEEKIEALMDKEDCTKILLNFSKTEYISSAGLRGLLSALKKGKTKGIRFALCTLQPYVQEVFDLSGLTQFFSIYAVEDEAIKNLA